MNRSFRLMNPWALWGLWLLLSSSCTTLRVGTDILAGRDRDRPLAVPPLIWQDRSPLRYTSGRIKDPPLAFWAVAVNLENPAVQVVVGPEPLSYGSVPSIRVSSFAEQFQCLTAINANPFDIESDREGEPRRIVGIAIQEGRILADPVHRYGALLINKDGTARIVSQQDLLLPDGSVNTGVLEPVRYAVGGFFPVLQQGRALSGRTARYPRSAVGVSQDGKILYLLAIDGRLLDSLGTTEEETGQLLASLGAWDGLLLDGGGSTSLVIQKQDGTYTVLNHPVHGGRLNQERAVATCLGFRLIPAP